MASRRTRAAIAALLTATLAGVSVPATSAAAPTNDNTDKKPHSKTHTTASTYSPYALGPDCVRWKSSPRVQTCPIYSPSMDTTIMVDLQLPYHANKPFIHLFGGMWQKDHQGTVVPKLGGLAHALSRTDVGFVSPVAGTVGSMWTDWRTPTLLSGLKPIKWETFFTKEIPAYLQKTFKVRTGPRKTIAMGVGMGAAGGASVMYRNPSVYRGGYFLSGFYNFRSLGGGAAVTVISSLSGNVGPMMWKYSEYKNYDPSYLADRTGLFQTRFAAGTGLLNLRTKEINLNPIRNVIRAYSGPTEAGMAVSTLRFWKTVDKKAPQALRQGKAKFVIHAAGVHTWNLWRDDMYNGGLQDVLTRNGVKYVPVENPAGLTNEWFN